MSGVVLTPDQLKEFKPDSGVKLTASDMKDFVPENGNRATSSPPSPPKSRSWSDVPKEALKNAVPSLGKTAENIGSALLHPVDSIESTVRGLSGGLDLFLKAMDLHPSKLYRDPGEYQKDVAVARSLLHHLSGRYGSEEAIKNTLATDPAGALLDASALLSPASGLLRKAGLPGAAEIAEKVTQAPVALAAKGVKAAGKVAGKGMAQTLGRMTGTSAESVAASLKGMPGFLRQMRGTGATEEEISNAGVQRLSRLKGENSDAYEKDLEAIGNSPLSTDPFVKKYVDKMKKERVSSVAGKNLDFSNSSLGPKGPSQLQEAHKLFRKAWNAKNMGFQDVVVMKHQLQNLLDETPYKSRARAVMTHIVKAVDDVLKQHPSYAKLTADYQRRKRVIDQMEKAFSLTTDKKRLNTRTILTKMQTIGRSHSQYGRDLVGKFDPSGNLQAQMYGLEMKPWFRRGMEAPLLWGEGGAAATGALSHSAALPGTGLGLIGLSSPRLVGEAGNLLGKTARGASALAERSRLPASGLLALLEEQGALANGQ